MEEGVGATADELRHRRLAAHRRAGENLLAAKATIGRVRTDRTAQMSTDLTRASRSRSSE
jgi:hypothetical protein